jgi:site-specific DNA-methyltransferase (adenine-specific)
MKTEQAVVYHGNCLDELKNIPDNYVDAIVTDPPYGLGDSDPNYIIDALKMWMDGDRAHIPAGKGFMGKQWDAFVPPPAVWDECFRVLKPGGYVLVFAGTRTVDLMGLSVRMAGFEIRDSLTWIYGQGFPKSLDISKAIDKLSGAEREVVGYTDPHDPRTAMARSIYGGDIQEGAGQGIPITAPATEDAKKWAGWGTALKPASEPIIMARKPLSEKTVAKNVLKWGTGGINIDGTRIGTEQTTTTIKDLSQAHGNQFGKSGIEYPKLGEKLNPPGRFPSNVMFSHADDCVQVGIIGDSYVINKTEEWSGFGQKERPDYESESKTVDVPIYECVEGCPVKELDEQSGIRPGGAYPAKRGQAVNTSFASGQETVGGARQMGDTGGASRFFYVAKANKTDRNEGLVGLDEKGKVFNGKNEESAGNAPGSVEDKFTTKPQSNFHPTVKPTSLMRQLVKMVAPEGAIVLDPFCGSGSTGKATILEGHRFIGIEMTDEYLPIIQGRLEHAIEQRKGTKE